MDFLRDLVDEVVVLDSGQVVYQGDMAGMYRSPQVREAYLGDQGQSHYPESARVAHNA
jgi:branched-chain amino acid transport system permease protein